MPLPLAPIISGGAGLIQGVIDSVTSRQNTQKTIAANKEMADYQYSKDLDMWNKGNTYNAPQAQMDRLKSAGLNPNLVYGSGTVAGQASGQLPKYNAPTMDYSHNIPVQIGKGANNIAEWQNFRLQQAQIDNLNASRHATYADTEIKKLEAIKRMNENNYLPEFLRQKQEQGNIGINRGLIGTNTDQQKFMQEFFKTENQDELRKTQLDAMRASTQSKRQQFEQSTRMFPFKMKAQQLNNAMQFERGGLLHGERMNFDDLMSNRLLQGSYKNDLLIQQQEAMRLQNETFYMRMFGTGAMNIMNAIKSKAPLSPGKPKMSPQKDSPSKYQRKGYGNRK
ncbi:MAG: DNA pilot protein [Microvirus sp.]|nr:MAG: DNA pilot protein [Microvirus sp.]